VPPWFQKFWMISLLWLLGLKSGDLRPKLRHALSRASLRQPTERPRGARVILGLEVATIGSVPYYGVKSAGSLGGTTQAIANTKHRVKPQ
jgi:hypothetical protein